MPTSTGEAGTLSPFGSVSAFSLFYNLNFRSEEFKLHIFTT